ncbi:uncharacterized protein KY384_008762 [Bacidia gigantensis]|uniref:uncharacterized protein n=1 Tax=Bacidia gigantensis TaxID=2732470 RepID=UPI001D056318|nr:uncharacterized protein KY384_008762 [Bacidia gigantensis]KAG8526561.1 hypothetical protein KY384_008762 [Bacidia gigantensis]
MSAKGAKVELPGFGQPLTARKNRDDKYPIAILGDGSSYESTTKDGREGYGGLKKRRAAVLTQREYTLMEMMNRITDKPDWQRKVFDEAIVEKWKEEFLENSDSENESANGRMEIVDPLEMNAKSEVNSDAMLQDESMTEDDKASEAGTETESLASQYANGPPEMTEKMVQWAIAECRYKAEVFEQTNCIEALDGVWKSDTIVGKKLKKKLQGAVEVLENVPEKDKDWHPGSNNQVLDLVHPSVYPMVYGQSKILAANKCGVNDCLKWTGKGETVPLIEESEEVPKEWSRKYQWLPAEVELSNHSQDVRAASYINNLHPVDNADLYAIIPAIIAKAIPLWNRVLSRISWSHQIPERVSDWSNSDMGYEKDWEENMPEEPEEDEDDADFEDRREAYMENREVIPPEPKEFKPPAERMKEHYGHAVDVYDLKPHVDLRRGILSWQDARKADSGTHKEANNLQIIVKLANIHLTPEKPEYEGGTWHVEGMANESILILLLLLQPNRIAPLIPPIRRRRHRPPYPQSDHRAVLSIYGIENEGPTIQHLGSVCTPEGRLLAFPNVMQHRVLPFKLADPTKPGHRKILALFLVDPHMRIIGTGEVPPQQKEWWGRDVVDESGVLGGLPREIQEAVKGLEYEFPVSLEKAREQREELMAERRVFVEENTEDFESRNTFSLCEH